MNMSIKQIIEQLRKAREELREANDKAQARSAVSIRRPPVLVSHAGISDRRSLRDCDGCLSDVGDSIVIAYIFLAIHNLFSRPFICDGRL